VAAAGTSRRICGTSRPRASKTPGTTTDVTTEDERRERK
jgi:hypothetical protein